MSLFRTERSSSFGSLEDSNSALVTSYVFNSCDDFALVETSKTESSRDPLNMSAIDSRMLESIESFVSTARTMSFVSLVIPII